jgi:beta-glucosidase
VTEVATPLTIYEQIAITTGADYWSTAGFPTAGLRSLRLADGPHGLRIQDDENPDHLGLGRSLPATCFPPAVTLASSWDLALVREVADALGREARSHGVDVLLGPGMNIKRSPLCGRNFEYFSEDPMLSGLLAAAVVEGLQSNRVAACVKHFAANNQETDRQRVSAEIDERTLREIYLRTFQLVIREANPWSIMSAYNKINGVYASENHWLLTDLLRGEWGYDGVVVSDWGAVHDPVEAVEAGTDLRMPGRPEDDRLRVAEASGQLDHQALANTAQRVALLAERTTPDNSEQRVIDLDQHHELTRRAAAESAVLLINDGTLPLNLQNSRRLAVIGELARTPRYQGAGSSAVNPTRVITGLDALTRRAEKIRGHDRVRRGLRPRCRASRPGAHRRCARGSDRG